MKLISRDVNLFTESRILIGSESLPVTSLHIEMEKQAVLFIVATARVESYQSARVFGDRRYADNDLILETQFSFKSTLCGIRALTVKEGYENRRVHATEVEALRAENPDWGEFDDEIRAFYKDVTIWAIPDDVFWRSFTSGKAPEEWTEAQAKAFQIPVGVNTNPE